MSDSRSDTRAPSRETARLPRFSDLARFRVRDILLVSSLYDSFILAEDSELQEVILKEFLDLNVRSTPAVTHVATAEEALTLARESARYNLVIASTYVGDTSAMTLARRLREAGVAAPVVALAYDMREVAEVTAAGGPSPLDRVFLWQGDVRLLPAIVKSVPPSHKPTPSHLSIPLLFLSTQLRGLTLISDSGEKTRPGAGVVSLRRHAPACRIRENRPALRVPRSLQRGAGCGVPCSSPITYSGKRRRLRALSPA